MYPYRVHDPGGTRTHDLRIKRTVGGGDTQRSQRERADLTVFGADTRGGEAHPKTCTGVSAPRPRSTVCGWCLRSAAEPCPMRPPCTRRAA